MLGKRITKCKTRAMALRAAAALALFYLLLCLGCASFQRRLIYFPPVFDSTTADQLAQPAHLERWLDPSGRVIGWKRMYRIQPAKGEAVVIHGNACAAVQCALFADAIQQAAPLDVFILEFPGYGDRPGKPTEKSIEAAAAEAMACLATNSPVIVVGESLGTGVAAYVAGQCPDRVAGLVLFAPYSSLTDVGQWHMPILPVHLLLADRFPAKTFLRNYHGPVAMLVGGTDPVVPEKFGRRLFEGYDGPKRLWEFPDENHGTVMLQPPQIWTELLDFLGASLHSPKS